MLKKGIAKGTGMYANVSRLEKTLMDIVSFFVGKEKLMFKRHS